MLVESEESVLGECARRAQLAGTKRGQRPACGLNISGDLRKTFGQCRHPVEAHALDLVAGSGGRAARILKHRRDEPVIAGRKVTRHLWRLLVSSLIPVACGRPWRR